MFFEAGCASTNPKEIYYGFLYKIKNNLNKTIGYLFGTIHDIADSAVTLDDRIFKYLSRSESLSVEMDLSDEETLIEHIRTHPKGALLSEEELQAKVKLVNDSREKNPSGADDLLILRAHSLGMKINSLETEESRRWANQSIQLENRRLAEQTNYLISYYMHLANQQLDLIDAETKGLKIADALLDGYTFLNLSIKNVDFRSNHGTKIDFLMRLIELYEIYFIEQDLDLNLIKKLKALVDSSKNADRSTEELMQRAWKQGCERLAKMACVSHSLAENKRQQLYNKCLHLRDLVMSERIHQVLLHSSEMHRHFFAIGAGHLIKRYKNVNELLKERGWRIKRVLPPHILSDDKENQAPEKSN